MSTTKNPTQTLPSFEEVVQIAQSVIVTSKWIHYGDKNALAQLISTEDFFNFLLRYENVPKNDLAEHYFYNHFYFCELCNDYKAYKSNERALISTPAGRIYACSSCIKKNNFVTCSECSCIVKQLLDIPEELIGIVDKKLCEKCYENVRVKISRIEMRGYQGEAITGGERTGSVIQSPRMWGCELELLVPKNKKIQFARSLSLPYMKPWGVGTDGSLNTDGVDVAIAGTYELRSPPFQGEEGERTFTASCTAIAKAGARVNNSCGMHIHLKLIGSPTHEKLKRIFMFYYKFDDVIQSFLPGSRRGNKYCIPMQRLDNKVIERMQAAKNFMQVAKAWYGTDSDSQAESCRRYSKHSSRYWGANFHLLLHRNILEIRYHSGTLNPQKVLEWTNLHSRIMDFCEGKLDGRNKITTAEEMLAWQTSDLSAATEKLFSILKLTQESVTYWKSRQKKFKAATARNETDLSLPIEKSGSWEEQPFNSNQINETCAA